MTDIRPCPFCGERYVHACPQAVMCPNCYATGPTAHNIDTAVERWNRRPEVVG